MAHSTHAKSRPYWCQVLRALREARGITQDGWAAQLGYGRATVKRWEAGQTVPSADAEAAIVRLCREKDLMRRFSDGPLAGAQVTPEWIADLLASARLDHHRESQSAPLIANPTPPTIRYALSGDVAIAYQTFGEGRQDLVVTPGAVSHREIDWEYAGAVTFFEQLAAASRVTIFDKRGTGMSDRVEAGTLEQRVDDIRAVMDAEGIERATLFGISEGGPMSILFAATYPERIRALVLYGSYASEPKLKEENRAPPPEQLQEQIERFRQTWGTPESRFLETYGPSVAGDPTHRSWWARHQRMSASPGAVIALMRMNTGIDVRQVLPAIRVPTLILHRTGDRAVEIDEGRYLAAQIPGSEFIELPGDDHLPWLGDIGSITGAVTDFITRSPGTPDVNRMLSSILAVSVLDPAQPAAGSSGEVLESCLVLVRRELARFRGSEVGAEGDTLLATFDGPTRAVRCAVAIRDAVRAAGFDTRSGVHTGEVEFQGDRVFGETVDACVSIAQQASPGEILVSRTVTDLVAGSGLMFQPSPDCQAHGDSGPWQLFSLHHLEK